MYILVHINTLETIGQAYNSIEEAMIARHNLPIEVRGYYEIKKICRIK